MARLTINEPSPACLLLVLPDLLCGKDEERAPFLQVHCRHDKEADLLLVLLLLLSSMSSSTVKIKVSCWSLK